MTELYIVNCVHWLLMTIRFIGWKCWIPVHLFVWLSALIHQFPSSVCLSVSMSVCLFVCLTLRLTNYGYILVVQCWNSFKRLSHWTIYSFPTIFENLIYKHNCKCPFGNITRWKCALCTSVKNNKHNLVF